jgi:hypothetical protein
MTNAAQTSDGYHTFDELYEHRALLFIALMRAYPEISWRANNHSDGTMYEDYFVAGMHLPPGDITYHMPLDKWEMLDGCNIITTLRAPPFDGYTSNDVLSRLKQFITQTASTNRRIVHTGNDGYTDLD